MSTKSDNSSESKVLRKSDIVSVVAESSGHTKAVVEDVLSLVIEAISTSLQNGHSVAFRSFGTFKISERQARSGVNPQTKEKIQIPAKTVVRFKAASQLEDLVNESK